MIIQACFTAKEKGVLSYKQYMFLIKRDFKPDVLCTMQSSTASSIIDEIVKSGWRVPGKYRHLRNDVLTKKKKKQY